MFLCVSLNPGVDKRLQLKQLSRGKVNRVTHASAAAGGKAAHVAMVLATLGAGPSWLGFAGGATGEQLIAGLRDLSIRVEAIPTIGCTRTNLEIVEDEGTVTEILEPGQTITPDELRCLEETMTHLLGQAGGRTTVIFSGSLPAGVPIDCYRRLTELAHAQGSAVFVDTSGEAFRSALDGQPEFVKPNREEAEFWSGKPIEGPSSALETLRAMLKAGAVAGAISLGASGMIWCSKNGEALFADVPKLPVHSCVGSGDATLAGFAFAAAQQLSPAEAMRFAAACGSANCLADWPGRARAEDIDSLREQIRVAKLA
jgi:1-phosphofructokinase family hexose kinase